MTYLLTSGGRRPPLALTAMSEPKAACPITKTYCSDSATKIADCENGYVLFPVSGQQLRLVG